MKKIKKNKFSALPSDVERAKQKDVLPTDIFIVSKAQGFEADREGHLMAKVAVIDARAQKLHASGYVQVTMTALIPQNIFGDKVPIEKIENSMRAYSVIEVDSSLINPAIALTALSKQEAVVIQTENGGNQFKILGLDKEE